MGQSGSYRHRIIWQHLQVTKDIYGGPSEEWVDARKSWASFESVTGREKFKNDQTLSETQFRVRCRYAADIEPTTWRIKDNGGKIGEPGTIYNIASVQPDNARRTMLLNVYLNNYDQYKTGGQDA